jgi:uncharacterized protein (TIGR00255 family)
MTGFGQASVDLGRVRIVVDARSVNHRYADVRLRLPVELAAMEAELRRLSLSRVRRGRVEIQLRLTDLDGVEGRPALNQPLLAEVVAAAATLRDRGLVGELDLATAIGIPGMFRVEPAELSWSEEERGAAADAVDRALGALNEDRRREGRRLAEELISRLGKVAALVESVRGRAAVVPGAVQRRLAERLATLSASVELDPARIAQEAALLAERCDVTEELVRLAAHLEQATEILTGHEDAAVGKRLDFLVQELQRETNTAGSKSPDLELTRLVLALKAENEKFREQVQNLE